jgi:hypothetical protein
MRPADGTAIAHFKVYVRQNWMDAGMRMGITARQSALMVKRIACFGIAAFCLYAATTALAQSKTPVANSSHRVLGNVSSSHKQRQPIDAVQPLPDAPSAQAQHPAETLQMASETARLPLPVSEVAMPQVHAGSAVALPEAPSASLLFRPVPEKKESGAFLTRYLNPSYQPRGSRYQPSSSEKVMGRATDAASRVFLMRDPTGKAHVNTAYFLRVLTTVAAENASRRYRARSGTAPLTNFGSTVGNDAGMNLLHEFGPGIRQKVEGHMPEVVSRIAQHLSRPAAR